MKHDIIKSVNASAVDLNCTNVFYCQNGENCTQVSICRQNQTCSQIEKCDQRTGKCNKKEVCKNEPSQEIVQQGQNQTQNDSSQEQPPPGPPQPVVKKSKAEIAEAKSRLAQLRNHLDVTLMFLGQDNVGKIIAKLEMDSADPPIPQSKMPELFKKCQDEVDNFMKKMEENQTPEEKEQDKKD